MATTTAAASSSSSSSSTTYAFKRSKLEDEDADPWKTKGAQRVVVWTPEVLRSALHNALGKAALDDVKLCCARGASLEWRDEGDGLGMSPTHLAVCTDAPVERRLEVLEYLLQEGLDVGAIDYVESTPLHCAASLGCAPLVARLIRAGANPRVWDAESLTPLHLAVNGGHLAACRALTDNWAPVDLSDVDPEEVNDPRRSAAENERVRLQGGQRVAVAGASLYIARRGTPLHVAAAANRLRCAEHLVECGADVSDREGPQRSTPLHIAARCGFLDMCRLLLDYGADLEAVDELGETPLMRAVEGTSMPVCQLLFDRGADVRHTNNAGLTALHIAAACGLGEFFRPLVEAGADVNAHDTRQYEDWDGARTPLMYAARNGDKENFMLLLELGADLRRMSKVGWPALFYAVDNSEKKAGPDKVQNRHVELVSFILDMDEADGMWCTVGKGRTILMVAAMQNAKECAELIISRQPWSLDWRDETGRTALHWASVRGCKETIDMMLDRGAKASIRDNDGKTPGELLPSTQRPTKKRQWEEARRGAMGEKLWDYTGVMENTQFRYMKKAVAARRSREIAQERQCGWCQKYTFDARRCAACKAAYYCSKVCQERAWKQGGHRLYCKEVRRQVDSFQESKDRLRELEMKPW